MPPNTDQLESFVVSSSKRVTHFFFSNDDLMVPA
jgi:hypothetical protein